jgi:AcrR family transcriptional regulator
VKPEPASIQERVLAVAARLFRTKGYDATTTREIAAALGIQKASLYYHISSKEDILYRMALESMREHLEGLRAAIAGTDDVVTRLRRAVEAHMSRIHSDSDRNVAALLEMRALGPESLSKVVGLRDEFELLLRRVVEEAQEAGGLRSDIDAKYLTMALLSTINWSVIWFRPTGRFSAIQLADLFFDLYLTGTQATETTSGSTNGERRNKGQPARARKSKSDQDGKSSEVRIQTRRLVP